MWSDVTAPCQQSRQRVLLSHPSSFSRSTGCWDLKRRIHSCLCVRIEQSWLLQWLAGLPKSTTTPLQRAQNAAARLVTQLGPRDHVSDALRSLHWLPVQERITNKLCLLIHLAHLADSVTDTANLSRRTRLRSASSLRYEQPRTRLKLGECSFAFAGPAAWNTVLSFVQELSDTESLNATSKLLFQRCYCCSTSFELVFFLCIFIHQTNMVEE